MNTVPDKCPYCGEPIKFKGRKGPYPGYMSPTTFNCGTVVSPHWSPPVRDRNCGKGKAKP